MSGHHSYVHMCPLVYRQAVGAIYLCKFCVQCFLFQVLWVVIFFKQEPPRKQRRRQPRALPTTPIALKCAGGSFIARGVGRGLLTYFVVAFSLAVGWRGCLLDLLCQRPVNGARRGSPPAVGATGVRGALPKGFSSDPSDEDGADTSWRGTNM